MDTRNPIPWWVCGIIGGVTLSVMTVGNIVVALPWAFREEVRWWQLAALPFVVGAMGFVSGSLVGLLRGLSRRLDSVGDGIIGAVAGAVYFLCCTAYFDHDGLLRGDPGSAVLVLTGALIGLLGGIWVGHGIRRDLEQEKMDEV